MSLNSTTTVTQLITDTEERHRMTTKTVVTALILAISAAISKPNAQGSAPTIGGYLYTEFKASGDDFADRTFDIHYLAVDLSGQVHPKILAG